MGVKVKSPSEHKVDGKSFAVEVQFIHKYQNTLDELGANYSIFFDPAAETIGHKLKKGVKGGDNKFIASLLAGVPSTKTKSNGERLSTDLKDVKISEFMENLDTGAFWAYDGSQTSPPCQEGIKWIILKEVQGISSAQVSLIKKYNKLAKGVNGDSNARAVRALGARVVYNRTKMSASALVAGATTILAAAYLF